MRSQIRGLTQATSNANDAVSLIQTAEGGLNETEDILHRMRDLAVQSANGTYTDEDRQQIQHEVDALKSEINRVSDATEFNEMKLLNGELSVRMNSKVPTNEYGALYGNIVYGLAIGGGRITVSADVENVYLEFTDDASGKGGENAYYKYDIERTNSELSQHIVINLAKGQSYSDEEIQKLIDNANMPKSNGSMATWLQPPTAGMPNSGSRVRFSSETGRIYAAHAVTYQLEYGYTKQRSITNLSSLGEAKPLTDPSAVRYGTRNINKYKSYSLTIDPNMAPGTYTFDKNSGTITAGFAAEYASSADATAALNAVKEGVLSQINGANPPYYANTDTGELNGTYYLDKDGNRVNNGNVTCSWSSFPSGVTKHTEYQKDANGQYVRDNDGNLIVDREYYTVRTGSASLAVKTTQATATFDRQSSWTIDVEANQWGSYADYIADEPKYRQPDVAGLYNMKAISGIVYKTSDSASSDIDVSIGDNGSLTNYVTVTLKEGAVISGEDIRSRIQSALDGGGYNYTVRKSESRNAYTPDLGEAEINSQGTIYKIASGNSNNDFKVKAGNNVKRPNTFIPGQRFVARVGTTAGQRQELGGPADLSQFLIEDGNGTVNYSDQIKLTANFYGKEKDYDNLVNSIDIYVDEDAGQEGVKLSYYTSQEIGGAYADHTKAELHLVTGVHYTNKDIEKILKDAGLDYTVELTDSDAPDDSRDGHILFNTSGGPLTIGETQMGRGLGTPDVADINDQLEFQIGANGVEDQKVGMDIIDASADALGITYVDVTTQDNANEAIETIDKAIKELKMLCVIPGAAIMSCTKVLTHVSLIFIRESPNDLRDIRHTRNV